MSGRSRTILMGAGTVAVLAAAIAGLFLLGTPTEERARRIDARRVTDLQSIRAATNLYWTRHGTLPGSLGELTAEPGVTINTRDPASSEPYAYQPVDSIRYEVCATFDRASEQISRDPERDRWAHAAGPQCFELDAEEIEDER